MFCMDHSGNLDVNIEMTPKKSSSLQKCGGSGMRVPVIHPILLENYFASEDSRRKIFSSEF